MAISKMACTAASFTKPSPVYVVAGKSRRNRPAHGQADVLSLRKESIAHHISIGFPCANLVLSACNNHAFLDLDRHHLREYSSHLLTSMRTTALHI